MQTIITLSPLETRFHACERFQRCAGAAEDSTSPHVRENAHATPEMQEDRKHDRKIVYVNPVTIGRKKWAQYMEDTKRKINSGESVTCLVRSLRDFVYYSDVCNQHEIRLEADVQRI
jgi:DNA cross-link repair 1C protein